MKRIVLILLTCFFVLNSCSIDDNNNSVESFSSLWHLIEVTGGLAGINDQFELETVVWSFDESNLLLTVENNNTDETKQDILDSGTYDYSIITQDGQDYLVIDNIELGHIFFSAQDKLTIDENETSNGPVADGFIYTFQRTLIIEP